VRESGKDNVEIMFSDNGCGMSLDVRRRAFDPFFTTRRDQGGTGLGLHIVYSIVTNRLGGRLDLDSEPGGGTRSRSSCRARAARAGGGVASEPGIQLNRRNDNQRSGAVASLRSVAPKIWLALPTSAVPFMTPAVSVKVPETPMPTGAGRRTADWRRGWRYGAAPAPRP
jgi:signal transduction histidine kinase